MDKNKKDQEPLCSCKAVEIKLSTLIIPIKTEGRVCHDDLVLSQKDLDYIIKHYIRVSMMLTEHQI